MGEECGNVERLLREILEEIKGLREDLNDLLGEEYEVEESEEEEYEEESESEPSEDLNSKVN